MASKSKKSKEDFALQVGQSWRLPTGRIEIVQVGKTLAHYKYFKGDQKRGVHVALKSITAVVELLREHGAKLEVEAVP